MKINILTFHNEINYGANLQAYALCKFLTTLGHDVHFINYRRSQEKFSVKNNIRKWIGKSISSTVEKCAEQRREKILKNIFKKFQNEFIPITPNTYYSLESIQKNPPEADCYIVGSDQVWSTKLIKESDLPVFLLAFGNKKVKRIAYAASSGGESFPKEIQSNVIKYLSQFNAIGTREETLLEHLSNIGVTGAKWVPDPTILLNWHSQINIKSISRDSKIGLFILNNFNYNKILDKSSTYPKEKLSNQDLYCNLSIELNNPFEWVNKIASLKMLITDSYHGALFAVYSKTPFIFLQWGSQSNRDIRITSFLKMIGLEDQVMNNIDINHIDQYKPDIEKWNNAFSKLEEMRITARKFITHNIKLD